MDSDAIWLRERQVPQLLNTMMEKLLDAKPENHVGFLADLLQEEAGSPLGDDSPIITEAEAQKLAKQIPERLERVGSILKNPKNPSPRNNKNASVAMKIDAAATQGQGLQRQGSMRQAMMTSRFHSWPPPQVKSRRTRIICTLGPATSTDDVIDKIVDAGMDIARLNYSHGTYADKDKTIAQIRAAEKRAGRPLALLADLPGPKIRLGTFPRVVPLKVGAFVDLVCGKKSFEDHELGTAERPRLPVPYGGLSSDLEAGHRVLLADGVMALHVHECTGEPNGIITCVVEVGGDISSRKGINLPNTVVSLPAVTEADLECLSHALDNGVDFVAISYVRTREDILPAKKELARRGLTVPIIAKIEHPSGLTYLNDILDEVDGVMVARGDLGVEIPMEMLPLAQEEILQGALARGLPVIVATQVLESMQFSPTPTRAELTDIATAIRQGTSALMLSGETSTGKYPVEAVQTMANVAKQIDVHPLLSTIVPSAQKARDLMKQALARAAVNICSDLNVDRILVGTDRGKTAALLAAYHPKAMITAVTNNLQAQRRTNILRGVDTLELQEADLPTNTMINAIKALVKDGRLKPNQKVACLHGYPEAIAGNTSIIRLFYLDAEGNISDFGRCN